MCKACAKNDALITLLLEFLSIIIKSGIAPKRWKQAISLMLEKGSGPRTDKLRIINLIEADLQTAMKVRLQARRDVLKSNEKMSDHNYGGRKGHTIESPLLEKRCNIDCATLSGKKNVWLIADWKACFDRKSPEIGALACRSLGLEADVSKMLMQALAEMKFVLRMNNSTLQATHGDERLGGAKQGNMLSVTTCVAQSCATFKFLEGIHEGIIIRGPIQNENTQRLILACVDDEDAFSEGDQALQKMHHRQKKFTAFSKKFIALSSFFMST